MFFHNHRLHEYSTEFGQKYPQKNVSKFGIFEWKSIILIVPKYGYRVTNCEILECFYKKWMNHRAHTKMNLEEKAFFRTNCFGLSDFFSAETIYRKFKQNQRA